MAWCYSVETPESSTHLRSHQGVWSSSNGRPLGFSADGSPVGLEAVGPMEYDVHFAPLVPRWMIPDGQFLI